MKSQSSDAYLRVHFLRIFVFVALLLCITYGFHYYIYLKHFSAGLLSAYLFLLMFFPCLLALALSFLWDENFSWAPFKLGKPRFYGWVSGVILAALVITAFFLYLGGVSSADWRLMKYKEKISLGFEERSGSVLNESEEDDSRKAPLIQKKSSKQLNQDIQTYLQLSPLSFFFLTFFRFHVFGVLLGLIPAVGQEIVWRVFLQIKLLNYGKVTGFTLLGLIWSFWNLPFVWQGVYFSGDMIWGSVGIFIMGWSFSIIFGYFYFESGSIWVSAFGFSLYQQAVEFFKILFPANGMKSLIELGATIPLLILAVFLIQRMSLKKLGIDPIQKLAERAIIVDQ